MLTAYRAGLKTVIIPKRNKKDMADIPQHVKRGINIIFAEQMDEVLAQALLPASPLPTPPPPARRRRS
jgi:ATP-dependent Lon protease